MGMIVRARETSSGPARACLWRPARRRFGSGAAVIALLAALTAAHHEALAADATGAASQDESVMLLARIQDAARTLDYSGVFTYQQGEFIQSSRVTHVIDGTGERERLEVLDGQPREYLRHNDEVQCLIPEKKTVLLERRRGDRFPGLLLGDPAALTAHYDIRAEDKLHRVAGRECQLVRIEPRDDRRYGYKLCADTRTHLLLKAQTLSTDRGVVEQVAFTSLRLGADVQPALLKTEWSTRDWTVIEPDLKTVDLAAKGWRIPAPPGFDIKMQVARLMGKREAVSQLVLTDGLAAISVFIEPYNNAHQSEQPRGLVRSGPINVYGTRIADFWVVFLGEVPPATLQQLAEATEYVPLAAPQ
ncbi:Sigma factor RpoE negative regulatory protein RseB precursor [plant metagenome]|uniref:Sigma factor RpoE negative regulatory protein RseB n=1 Tax=plant metagenome TaxID=1297885 RepID=A0A484P0H8_9ZZZZ